METKIVRKDNLSLKRTKSNTLEYMVLQNSDVCKHASGNREWYADVEFWPNSTRESHDDLRQAQIAFFDLAQSEKVHAKASSKIKRLGWSVSQRRMPRETEKPPLTMIDEKPTDGTSTSKKKDQDGHGMMKSENFLGVLGIHSPNPDDEFKNCLSRWTWRDECSFFLQSFSNSFFLVLVHM